MEYGRKFLYGMKDFWYGMEENCQYGIWKNRLPFHTMPWFLMEKLKSLYIFVSVNHHINVGYFNLENDCCCDTMQYEISKQNY